MAEYGKPTEVIRPVKPSQYVTGDKGITQRLLKGTVGLIAFFFGAFLVTAVFCDAQKGECSLDKRLGNTGISTLGYFAIQGFWLKSKEEDA